MRVEAGARALEPAILRRGIAAALFAVLARNALAPLALVVMATTLAMGASLAVIFAAQGLVALGREQLTVLDRAG